MSQHFISPELAQELIDRYRKNVDNMTTPDFKGSMIYSERFEAAAIQAILDQPGCVSFRIYFGMKDDKTICSIFYGVDAEGNDIVAAEKPVIVDKGLPCPPNC